MFDRQLPKSRALISGTSSPRIIFQRWSFNDINLYPCSCSKDNNHDHFSLWLRNAKKLKLFSHKKPVALFVRFILSRERKSGKSARKMLKLQAQRSRRTRGGSGGGGGKFSAPHSSQHTSPLRIPIFKRLYFEWNALNHFFSKSASPALL